MAVNGALVTHPSDATGDSVPRRDRGDAGTLTRLAVQASCQEVLPVRAA